MDVLLPEDRTRVVEYYSPKRPASATYRFLSSSGAEIISSTAATVDTFAATIATVTDAETIEIESVTGTAYAGRKYWWVSADGQESMFLLGQKDSTSLMLEWPVARATPEVGDTLDGARITATLSTTATANRGENYLIEWTTTNADSTVTVERQVAHVVRAEGRPAVDAGFAKACVSVWWPDLVRSRGFGFFAELAERASERVWRRLRRTGRFLHLLWDASDFDAAGRVALQLELAHDGYIPGGVIDRGAHIESLENVLNREVDDVVSSRPYDEDDSGGVDADTEVRPVNSMSLRRW